MFYKPAAYQRSLRRSKNKGNTHIKECECGMLFIFEIFRGGPICKWEKYTKCSICRKKIKTKMRAWLEGHRKGCQMDNVIKLPLKHVQAICTDDYCNGGCYACTLGVCSVCMCFEGSLTTHCSGKRVDEETQQKIYTEGLDYYNNEWITLEDTHPMNKNPLFRD